jgi:hypothetical protein
MTNANEKIDDEKASSHGNEPDISSTPSYQAEHNARDYGTVEIKEGAKFMEVMNAEYALALSTGPQLKATSWHSIQLFGILLIAFMGSLSNGFDGSGTCSQPRQRCNVQWQQ